MGNALFVELFLLCAVALIIFCGVFPFIHYYFSLHPFPRLHLPQSHKEHLSMGEMVAAIQRSSTSLPAEEEAASPQEVNLSLSSAEVEQITQTNTKRNSHCQLPNFGHRPSALIEGEAEGRASTLSVVRRLSQVAHQSLASVAHHRLTQENIERRCIRWNPAVTFIGSLADEDAELEEREPLPPLPTHLMPRGILRHPPRLSTRSPPAAPSPLPHSALTLEDSIEDTFNPLFPVPFSSSSALAGRDSGRRKQPPSPDTEEIGGWRRRKESYEVYRSQARSPPRRERMAAMAPQMEANRFKRLEETSDDGPRMVVGTSARRHTHNVTTFPVTHTLPLSASPSLLKTQTPPQRQQRHSHSPSSLSSGDGLDLSQSTSRVNGRGGKGSARKPRPSSRSPPRFDESGKRIIELEELESPHHPIWVGVESEDREAYEQGLLEETGRGRDQRRSGRGGAVDVHLMGLGREEGKMLDMRFKDVV
jgi:hypothetical protein